jgi:hypothetical protein
MIPSLSRYPLPVSKETPMNQIEQRGGSGDTASFTREPAAVA